MDFDPKWIVEKLTLLLRMGCRIDEVDKKGSNCLHAFFGRFGRGSSKETWKDALIFLIDRGADPFAIDYFGRSVSDIAYSETCRDRFYGHSLGTYRGDLFDSVLFCCGYTISEFRKGYSRTRIYGYDYTRRDFEKLWEGQEHLCPTWDDDEEWVNPQYNIIKLSEKNSRQYICTCVQDSCIYKYDVSEDFEVYYYSGKDEYLDENIENHEMQHFGHSSGSGESEMDVLQHHLHHYQQAMLQEPCLRKRSFRQRRKIPVTYSQD